MAIVKANKTCYVCGSTLLSPILSLGELYVSDFVTEDVAVPQKFPLELVLCNKKDGGCGLLQLKHIVPHDMMYRQYWYRSGINQAMARELGEIAATAEQLVRLKHDDYVMDIGANDGTLLRSYTTPGINRIGFEPANNLMPYAREGTTAIINEFFNFTDWQKTLGNAQAKIITAIAMFYDLEDPNRFVADVSKCLAPDGIFIIQMSYLPSMLSQNAFDNICHEHLEYYSLLSLENLLQRHNLAIVDVTLNDVNGGSFRIYTCHRGRENSINIAPGGAERVQALRASEHRLGLDQRGIYDGFVRRVSQLKNDLYTFIDTEHARGKKIHVYGASTKGNTLLQFYGLDHRLIEAAAERNPDKWGKKTVGTKIPIISEVEARQKQPDYFLILPWHFLDEFIKREADFLKAGGKFIVPLPQFKVIGYDDVN